MKFKNIKWLIFLLLLLFIPLLSFSQEENEKAEDEKRPYQFTVDYQIPHTPVKNQASTGTCWCFSTVSFLEAEFLRQSGEQIDLSEMFVVRNTYPQKAENFIRLHGNATFGQGGQSHDVIDQIRLFGIVPDEIYPGMLIDEIKHNHGEMFAVLNSILDGTIKAGRKRLTPRWKDAFVKVLDVYLGEPPVDFDFKGKKYTPKSFAEKYLKLNLDDYIEFTSYSHKPFYEKCRLEVPDNWTFNENYYNVPIEDVEKMIDRAIKNGYSVVWDGDVSEKDFSIRETGYAIVPEKDWDDKTEAEKKEKLTEPAKEKKITQEMRQATFDNYETTDDHLMHIVGIAHDQKGNKFYYTKNSGGIIDRKNDGYIYMSLAYVRLKTIALMVNKQAVSKKMQSKLANK